MLSPSLSPAVLPFSSGPALLLVSTDPLLIAELQRIFHSLDLHLETVSSGPQATAAIQTLSERSIVLLDGRMRGVSDGQLLAAITEPQIHRRCAIALIADQVAHPVSGEWIARLREGVIDDIVPRNTDAAGWTSHIHAMQRSHELYRELEDLRASSPLESRHDQATGTFNRDTMLTLLFRETDRVQRMSGALSTLLLQLDTFSDVLHDVGTRTADSLMREVALRISRLLRSYDLLGRSGPEAFLIALPGCSVINAMTLAERMRTEVFDEPFIISNSAGEERLIELTACFSVTSSRGRSPIVVLREAEHTLARAKMSGPGTLRCASESPLAAEANGPRLFPGAEIAVW